MKIPLGWHKSDILDLLKNWPDATIIFLPFEHGVIRAVITTGKNSLVYEKSLFPGFN